MRCRYATAALVALGVFAAAPLHAAPASTPLTLERIMADPDWIGPPVEQPYWSADGHSLYYQLKRSGSPVRDLYRVDVAGGAGGKVDDAALADADGGPVVFDRTHMRAAFVRHGDVFIRELASGRLLQVTRTPQREMAPQFSANGTALQFRAGNDWFVYTLASGVTAPAAVLRAEQDPEAKQPDDLGRLQLRLFKTLREAKADRDALRAREQALDQADATRVAQPFYLGDDVQVMDTELSPNGRWMLVVTAPKNAAEGRKPELMRYVTESGYAE
ncbi:MAG TPA: S9 family peptidase, partial [Mizugakiibacter sp.]